jgi:hypothetical protein
MAQEAGKMTHLAPEILLQLGEPEVGLVEQRRGVQRLPGVLAPKVRDRDAVRLAVEERHQAIERGTVPTAMLDQESGDLGARHEESPAIHSVSSLEVTRLE